MSSLALDRPARPPGRGPLPPGARSTARTERRKLIAQLPIRVLILLSLLGPFLFAVLLRVQSGTPSDALFGVWVHSSGFAIPLVVLSFAANWGFPVIAGIVAGDLFASEDRHGTWKTILTRSRSLPDVFVGKTLAAFTLVLILALVLAVASIVAGLTLVGAQPMVDLGGRELSPSHLLGLASLSWVISFLPVLAYTSLAILFSVISRNGIVGVLGPVLVSLLTQLLALLGKGAWLHLLLIGSAFDAWHGLFVAHPYFGPLVVSVLACLGWIVGALILAWTVLRGREFVASTGRGTGWRRPTRAATSGILVLAVMAVATNLGPAGVTRKRLAHTLAPEFERLTTLQQRLLGHPIPAGARYRIVPVCGKRSPQPVGPGDWSCTMNVYILLARGTQPLTDTPVAYDVSVQSNGCFKAQSPPLLVGQAVIHDVQHQAVVNPIVTIYGCFNII